MRKRHSNGASRAATAPGAPPTGTHIHANHVLLEWAIFRPIDWAIFRLTKTDPHYQNPTAGRGAGRLPRAPPIAANTAYLRAKRATVRLRRKKVL
jgi:hypothetical protein